jgi:hypothetical protein
MEICSCNTRLKGENYMQKKKSKAIIVIVIAISIVIILFCFKHRKLDSLYAGNISDIEQVSIVSGGTGDIVVVKNTEDIEKLAQYFGEYKLQPDYFYSDSKTGWSYGIKFEWENKQIFITCIDTDRVKVDTKVYKVKNGDSMENSLKDLFDELSE